MYADYSYYQETFGGTMPEAAYAAAERKAEACISYLTYLNGDIFATEDDRVKQAVCTAADVILEDSQKRASGSAGLKSESNDGYSVSYVTEQQDGQTAEEALRRKVFEAIYLCFIFSSVFEVRELVRFRPVGHNKSGARARSNYRNIAGVVPADRRDADHVVVDQRPGLLVQ